MRRRGLWGGAATCAPAAATCNPTLSSLPSSLHLPPSLPLQTLWDTLPQNLFAVSIIPYTGFLYHLHRSKQAPPMTLFGFYFLLAFVFATIPAGIFGERPVGKKQRGPAPRALQSLLTA